MTREKMIDEVRQRARLADDITATHDSQPGTFGMMEREMAKREQQFWRQVLAVVEPPRPQEATMRAIGLKAMTALSYGAGHNVEAKERALLDILQLSDPPAPRAAAPQEEKPR